MSSFLSHGQWEVGVECV
uniref:Uncharacterized protein n=1 Tax=Rhizophora mucronata TaxID=61149 RepID=A0A2P2QKV8_RHIMU